MTNSPDRESRPITGVLPVVQTPFFPDGRLDLESLRQQARYICRHGAPGLAFPGFASEWWKLSGEEIRSAAEVLRRETAGRALLILNVTCQSSCLAVEQARDFAALGCDALMCLPPFLMSPTPAAVAAHLRAVLGATSLPHILHYSESLTGVGLEPERIRELRHEFPHLRCIKVDHIPPAPMISRLIEVLGRTELTYLIGFAGLHLAESIERGAQGLMGGAGHLEEDLRACQALMCPSGMHDKDVFYRLLPLLNFEMQTVGMSIAVHKQLLFERGVIECPHIRAPGAGLDDRQVQQLRSLVAHAAA